MKLLALITIGIAYSGGGLECLAGNLRALGFEATVSEQEVWVESKKPITDKQMDALHGIKYINSIRLLDGGFTDSGVAKLKDLDGLKVLVLKSADLTDEATVAISKLSSVTKLDLMGAKLTSVGIVRIARLPNLRELYLHSAKVEAKDLAAIKRLKNLQALTLPFELGPGALAEMKSSLPNTRVSIPPQG